jgi:hypothetical protein
MEKAGLLCQAAIGMTDGCYSGQKEKSTSKDFQVFIGVFHCPHSFRTQFLTPEVIRYNPDHVRAVVPYRGKHGYK